MEDRFITVAIHTYDRAIALRALLEREGIVVQFRNVNIEQPVVSSGIRVRIPENDLPLALRIIENREIFSPTIVPTPHGNPANPVLVPVDFSEVSLEATKAAFQIANAHSTSIVLLHTYIDPYVTGSMQLTDSLTYEIADSSLRQQTENAAKMQMRHFTDQLRDLIKSGALPPVKFDTCVTEGVPEDAINEYTKANNPFLIVMGTRGTQKKQADLIGSVTAEVLDKCRFTVLAIPEMDKATKIGSLRNILLFSNIEQEDILAIDTLYRIFPDAEAHVTIVNIPGKKRLLMRSSPDAPIALRDYCRRNFKKYTFDISEVSLDKMVEDFRRIESEGKFDLVVIPNKKKNVLSRLFNPSLAHRVLFSADVPMLVIPV